MAKFDEDFTQIEYSATECIDSSGSSDGFYGANVIFYGGRFRMAYCDRKTGNPDSSTWEIREAFGETPESFTDSAVICAGAVVNDGLYRSSHSDECCYFTHRGRLYLLVSGTSRYKNSGNRGNRCFGLFYLDDDGTWREDIRNPVFITRFTEPMSGDRTGPGVQTISAVIRTCISIQLTVSCTFTGPQPQERIITRLGWQGLILRI